MIRAITTPIFYPNADPHLGHAYTTIAADALARYHRGKGGDVRLITGTDEHAEKIAKVAEERGFTPQAFVELMRPRWENLMETLGVQAYTFVATDKPLHHQDVQRFFLRRKERGEVTKGVYEGWYNVREARFVPPMEAEKCGNRDPLTGDKLEEIEEPAWFFPLSKWAPKVADHIEANPEFVKPMKRRHEILSRLRGPVEDLCITRPKARHAFGVEVPDDEDFVFYVWFDALISYLTGVGWEREDNWEERWKGTIHLLAQDILWFHAGVWPALLMAADVPLPLGMQLHGYLTIGETKMSKSLGNVIDPTNLGEGMGPFGDELVRFFCLHEVAFGSDRAVHPDQIGESYNAYLANEVGNLLHRAGTMVERWLGGKVPPLRTPLSEYTEKRDALLESWRCSMEACALQKATESALDLMRWGHKYINDAAPWQSQKEGDVEALKEVFAHVGDVLVTGARMLAPIMPKTAVAIQAALGATEATPSKEVWVVEGGTTLRLPEQLFPRIEAETPPKKEKKVTREEEDKMIGIEEFSKVSLRVGTVIKAEPHPDAERLLVLGVDVGEANNRQLVAGIAGSYKPKELVGRQVVVVANLKPALLRGEKSEGMILAASDGAPVLLSPDRAVPPGTKVK